MPLGDLRSWLAEVERIGELWVVHGAHWREEIGAASEVNLRAGRPAALLFDEIPDYPPGYRVLTSSNAAPSRLGLSLRLGANHSTEELTRMLPERLAEWRQRASEFPIEWVEDGPVSKCVREGAEVDLTRFPAPLWHEGDGGRYLGTSCLVITRDPDSGWINAASYRMQLHGPRELGLYILTGKHGRMHLERHFERGEPCPVAVSFGHDPLLALLAGVEIPFGVSELEYAGAVAGQRLRVIRGTVTGLPLPAYAEIVVEGFVRPGNVRSEGPFGEFHGYYSGTEEPQPVLEVERILHRPDPIILGAAPGKPPHDYSYWVSVLRSALVMEALNAAGVPFVRGAWQHEVGGSRMLLVVSIKQAYAGHARQAGLVASGCRPGAQLGRYVIVVDDDIDPTNLGEVMWAVATRSDPATDIDVIRQIWGSLVDPQFVTYRGADPAGAPFNSRAIVDACIPFDHRDDFPAPVRTDEALLRALREKWPWLENPLGSAAAPAPPLADQGALGDGPRRQGVAK
jgi:UbiD family decarboxylase